MNKELEEQLYLKYPKIFADKDKSMQESCMYWGLECGAGWYDLIDKLCENIQNYLDSHIDLPQVVATQVKEKFGFLCFYIDGGDDTIYQFISEASHISSTICEECGSMEEVTNTKGWIKYLCKNCMDKYNVKRLKIL